MRRLLFIAASASAAVTVSMAVPHEGWGAVVAASAAPPRPVPAWLVKAERHALSRIFGNPKVVHTYHLWYPSKVAVIFEFQTSQICRSCTAPSQSARPRGRVVRLTFDRQTRSITSGLQFCEIRGASPPRALCLRR